MADDPNDFATPRVAAGVLFRTDDDRVLLVKPTYKDGWDIPGGYVNKGESPHAAAVREVKEELGVDWPIGELLAVDWAPHPDEGDKILFLFDGAVVDEHALRRIALQLAEISRAQLWAIAELAQALPLRLAQRVFVALQPAGPRYLERGRPLP